MEPFSGPDSGQPVGRDEALERKLAEERKKQIGDINILMREIIADVKKYSDLLGFDDSQLFSGGVNVVDRSDIDSLGWESARGSDRITKPESQWISEYVLRLDKIQKEIVQSTNLPLDLYLRQLNKMRQEISQRMDTLSPKDQVHDKARDEVNRIGEKPLDIDRDSRRAAKENLEKIKYWAKEYQKNTEEIADGFEDSERDEYQKFSDRITLMLSIDEKAIEAMNQEDVWQLVIEEVSLLNQLLEGINHYS